jgi:ABC-type siderophore export system fused ATPase/permease subunit
MTQKTLAIPSEFELAGTTYKVIYKEGLAKSGSLGQTHPNSGEIWLDSSLVPEDIKQATFYHELFHALFSTAGRYDLYQDEGLVDLLGNLLWQYLKTSKIKG